MKVFISWSGERSKAVAEFLKGWLPLVIHAIEPWMSSAIEKGSQWSAEINKGLLNAQAGVICLTHDNLTEPWILYEAGALFKAMDERRVCTFLLDLQPADVKFPLAQFQATTFEKGEVYKLIDTLNRNIPENERKLDEQALIRSFNKWWPELDQSISAIPRDEISSRARRSQQEILEEILALVRSEKRESVITRDKEPLGVMDLLKETLITALTNNGHETAASMLTTAAWHISGSSKYIDVVIRLAAKATLASLTFKPAAEFVTKPLEYLPSISTLSILAADGTKVLDYDDIPF